MNQCSKKFQWKLFSVVCWFLVTLNVPAYAQMDDLMGWSSEFRIIPRANTGPLVSLNFRTDEYYLCEGQNSLYLNKSQIDGSAPKDCVNADVFTRGTRAGVVAFKEDGSLDSSFGTKGAVLASEDGLSAVAATYPDRTGQLGVVNQVGGSFNSPFDGGGSYAVAQVYKLNMSNGKDLPLRSMPLQSSILAQGYGFGRGQVFTITPFENGIFATFVEQDVLYSQKITYAESGSAPVRRLLDQAGLFRGLVSVESDKSVLALSEGASSGSLVIRKYLLESGSLDPTFGDQGVAQISVNSSRHLSTLIANAQHLYVVNVWTSFLDVKNPRMEILRLSLSGQVDPGYSANIPLKFGGLDFSPTRTVVSQNGSIVVAGYTEDSRPRLQGAHAPSFGFFKINSDGGLDSLDGCGGLISNGTIYIPVLSEIAVDEAGRIYVASHSRRSQSSFTLTRFLRNGGVDFTFDGGVPPASAAQNPTVPISQGVPGQVTLDYAKIHSAKVPVILREPPEITEVEMLGISGVTAQVSFQAQDGAVGYEIQVMKDNEPTPVQDVFAYSSPSEIFDMDLKSNYRFRIRSYNATGFSNWSDFYSLLQSASFVQSRLINGDDPFRLIDDGAPIPIFYGLSFQGGLIASVDTGKKRMLIAAPTDFEQEASWYNLYSKAIWRVISGRAALPNTSESLWDGAQNTKTIFDFFGLPATYQYGDGVNYAAYQAQMLNSSKFQGYSDWYLPSVMEMQAVLTNVIGPANCSKIKPKTGGIPNYWTSSASEKKSGGTAYRIACDGSKQSDSGGDFLLVRFARTYSGK